MRLDGSGADLKANGDLLVRVAAREVVQDLALAWCQRRQARVLRVPVPPARAA